MRGAIGTGLAAVFALAMGTPACGGGGDGDGDLGSGDSNEYVCNSCPDAVATEDECETWAEEADCESFSYETVLNEGCQVGGEPVDVSVCTLENCPDPPACFER